MRHGPALFLTLSLFATTAFAAGPYVGVEQPVTPPATGLAVGGKIRPLVASDGRDFLVVWADRRTGRLSVYATRVASSGEELDSPPIVLLEEALDVGWWSDGMTEAEVLWDGNAYIVSRLRDVRMETFLVRVTPAGKVTSEPTGRYPARVYPRNAFGETVEVKSDNEGTDVFFVDADGVWRSYLRFISEWPKGFVPQDNGEWAIIMTGRVGLRWVRARKGVGILSYQRLHNPTMHQVTYPAGNGRTAAVLIVSAEPLGAGRTPFFKRFHRTVSWSTMDTSGEVEEGVLESEDIEVPYDSRRAYAQTAVSVFGDTFHFAYTRGSSLAELRAFTVKGRSAHETLIDGPAPQPDHYSFSPSMASSATHTLLAWLQPCAASSACHVATRLYPNGGSADEVATRLVGAKALVTQEEPAAASSATSRIIAWREIDATVSVRARVVPHDGSAAAVIKAGELEYGLRDVVGPRVAATADAFAVAWVENERKAGIQEWEPGRSHVKVRRFTAQGVPIDALPLRLALDGTARAIDIAPRGNGFEVVWLSSDVAVSQYLPVNGAPGRMWRLAPNYPSLSRFDIGVAPAGNGAAVVWTEALRDSQVMDLVAVSIDGAGEVSSPLTLARTRIDPNIELAANDREVIVATLPEARQSGCAQAGRFTFGLSPLLPDGDAFCGEVETATALTPLWDGSKWWMALASAGEGLRATSFDAAWIPEPAVNVADAPLGRPALTRGPNGTVIAYSRRVPEAGMVSRVFVRTLSNFQRTRAVRH